MVNHSTVGQVKHAPSPSAREADQSLGDRVRQRTNGGVVAMNQLAERLRRVRLYLCGPRPEPSRGERGGLVATETAPAPERGLLSELDSTIDEIEYLAGEAASQLQDIERACGLL